VPKVFPRRLGALVLAAVSLAGCAANRVPTPNHASAEYIRSWGLKVIHADAAYRAGATGREIAQVMFRTGALDRSEWQTSSARHAVKALIRDARAMIAGGYRKLLRHRRAY